MNGTTIRVVLDPNIDYIETATYVLRISSLSQIEVLADYIGIGTGLTVL